MPFERIAVVETKVDALSTRIDEIARNVQTMRDVLTETRGAGRLLKFFSVFFGVATVAEIAARWHDVTRWIGGLGN